MDITRGINHIGLTVPDIEAATHFLKGLTAKSPMIVKQKWKHLAAVRM